jgi:hypothetical protein
MTRETNIANFPGLPGGHKRFHRSAFREYAVSIVKSENFMVLQEVNMIGFQPL